jgi:Kef-type K+ transport system membrane component KefB
VATAGKFGGTTMAAKLVGLDWRDSAALGILMNTRGLVELIVLNIGLDLGVVSPRLFTMLVIMALVTTMMTSPMLTALLRKRPWQQLNDTSAA